MPRSQVADFLFNHKTREKEDDNVSSIESGLGRLISTVRSHPDGKEKGWLLGSACRRLTQDATDDELYNLGGRILWAAVIK